MPRRTKKYWLMKSEPSVYSIDDLQREGQTCWEGIRNYQARNFMRDDMAVGDGVLFYHSNADPPGVAGLAKVSRQAYPDHFAFDPSSKYHDPKSTEDDPTWLMVDVAFEAKFPVLVDLATLKAEPALEGMLVTRRGQRLSIQPVEKAHFDAVKRLAKRLAK